MKMQIKGILFDFDGTIANTIDLIIATFEHTCREVLGFTVLSIVLRKFLQTS